jgi:1-acyl-sn-glycerol-3-phosphate acyltransferase
MGAGIANTTAAIYAFFKESFEIHKNLFTGTIPNGFGLLSNLSKWIRSIVHCVFFTLYLYYRSSLTKHASIIFILPKVSFLYIVTISPVKLARYFLAMPSLLQTVPQKSPALVVFVDERAERVVPIYA